MHRYKNIGLMLLVVASLFVYRSVQAQAGGPVQPIQQTQQVNGYSLTLNTTPATGEQGVMVQVMDPKGQLMPDAQVMVNFIMPGMQMTTVPRPAVAAVPGRYDGMGAFSMAGTWDVEVTVTPANAAPLVATFHVPVVDAVPLPARPAPLPPSFWTPWTATSLGLLVVGLVAAAWTQWGRKRQQALGFVVSWLLILAAAGTWLVPTALGAPYALGAPRQTSISRATPIFKANCAPCHGVAGHGDGLAARTLNPPPANLTAPHVDQHPDGQIYGWIHDGFPGSAMPAFGQRLTSDQIWDLVDYVRHLRAVAAGTAK
ncbi:MAG: c-type cytochrome [Herpetosiphonaceae bacterium]|nr:c-type cytochrome [Herpetosiphonaceae bacterium]